MLNATAGRPLATTITGSIPRPAWFDQNLGGRTFRHAMGDSRYREQYQDAVSSHIRDQERAGLDIVTDGDCRFDADVGGQSWFLYPARRLDGLSGDDYPAVGYGSGRGTIIFEAMEARIMPRVSGPIARGRLQYADVFKLAQELTPRPVKFGTITPEVLGLSLANDHYSSYGELVMAMSDAFREELLDRRRRRLQRDPARGAERSPGERSPPPRRRGARRVLLRRRVQQHGARSARAHRGVVPLLLGQHGAAAPLRRAAQLR